MSKELVISAASHERRVAILEEGQLVEIYIEREKEFALVGSIYKGKVTRVLPGMQSAFVDIGLDGDAFLYVSDVFENLEDYDDHGHEAGHAPAPSGAGNGTIAPVEGQEVPDASSDEVLLPGESRAKVEHAHDEHDAADHGAESEQQPGLHDEEHLDEPQPGNRIEPIAARSGPSEDQPHEMDERQPESNASAPQNFGPSYKQSQNYGYRGGNDRAGQTFNRGNDRGADRGNDRGGNEQRQEGGGGGRGRFGRRGGRRRGGRPTTGGGHQGRNLPPSKYASPQGGAGNQQDSRDQRGPSHGHRSFDNRRPESSRPPSTPAVYDVADDPIVLPGENLAKYRGKPPAPPAAPIAEQESSKYSETPETPRAAGGPGTSATPAGGPRRFTGGLPRWLLADAGSESEAAPVSADENIGVADDSTLSAHGNNPPRHEASPLELPHSSTETETLNDDQIAALAHGIVEAKQEEIRGAAPAESLSGSAIFEEEEEDEEDELEGEEENSATESELDEDEEDTEEAEEEVRAAIAETRAHAPSDLHDEERADLEDAHAAHLADEADAAHEDAHAAHLAAEADAAHETAEHHAELGMQEDEHEAEAHGDENHGEEVHSHEHNDSATEENAGNSLAASSAAPLADDAILLPGETRAPRQPGAPREDFPRESARVGGNPRQRFQRPFRSGGRDRNRGDNRGSRGESRGDNRGNRPDNRHSSGPGGHSHSGPRHDRGGRPGQRFERRPGGGQGGPRHDRGHQGGHHGHRRPQLISEMLKAGQDVVIQIAKEPLGKKGARITSHVALPGRFLVYMPTIDHIGVSRKIASAENRSRLRRLVGEARGSYPGGFIVRTAAGGATDEEIRADIEFLGTTWNEIKERSEQRKAPSLLHRDLNLVERILRDYVSDDFTAIWIDSEEEYSKVVEFVSRFQPKLVSRVKLYTKETPIFEEFGIQHELDKALRAKVWLKSGGYIVINHTEALVAIDVNTGKFVGKGSTRLEDTIVKTNLEAVKEIVRQIRLRDLGGIIVVDFIDMEERRNRDKVLFALQQALEEDKAPSKALSFNEFGLVCITRKRTKQALERVLCQPCPYCTGSGMVKSIPTLCYEIQAEARKMAMAGHEGPNLTLRVHPEIAKALKTRESLLMDELEQTSHKHIIIQSDATLHWEQYDIY